QAYEHPDVHGLDGPVHRDAEHGTAGVPEDDMTASRLAVRDAKSLRDRFQLLDTPVLRIGFHEHQGFHSPAHVSPKIVLYEILSGGPPGKAFARGIPTGPG